MPELADSIRSAVGRPFWPEGTPFSKFARDLQDYLTLRDLAEVLHAPEMGLDPLVDAPLKKARVKVFAILRQAVSAELYNTIDAKCTAADAASDDHDGTLCITGAKGNNPALLWKEIVLHSHGTLPAMAGQDLRQGIRTWVYPADPHKSQVELVNAAITAQTALVQRAALLKDVPTPHSQAQACSDIRADLPPTLAPNSRAYRNFVTLPELRLEMIQDARELDAKPEMVTLMAALRPGLLPPALLAAAAPGQPITPALLAGVGGHGGRGRGGGANGNGGGGGGSGGAAAGKARVYVSNERRMNESAGPPWGNAIYCTAHGWCGHTNDKCTKQRANAAPALAAAVTSGKPLFEQLANGDFQRALVAHEQPSTSTTSAITLAALCGGMTPTYVDCGGSVSIVKPARTSGCIEGTYRKFDTPRIVGGVGSGVLAHGEVERAHAIRLPGTSSTVNLRNMNYVAPDSNYELIATNRLGLGAAGISSKQDAEDLPDMPVTLEFPFLRGTPGAPDRLICTPYNGLYILPEVPFTGALPSRGLAQLVRRPVLALASAPIGGVVRAPSTASPPRPLSWAEIAAKTATLKPGVPTAAPVGGIVRSKLADTTINTGTFKSGVPVPAIGGIVRPKLANTATFKPGVPRAAPVLPIGGIVRAPHALVAPSGATDAPQAVVQIGDVVRAQPPAPPAPPTDAVAAPTATARLASFAGRFGAPQSLAESLAPCLGVKLPHKSDPDAVAYNKMVQQANQTARPVTAVDGDTSLPAGHLAFGGDTIGGKFLRSFAGNQFALVFVDHTEGKRDPSVSVFNSHHSVNSCRALADWISTTGLPLKLDGAPQPNIHCYVDNGTELQGDFKELLD